MQSKVEEILAQIRHPETGAAVVSSVRREEDKWVVDIALPRPQDPFRKSIARQIESELSKLRIADYELQISNPALQPPPSDLQPTTSLAEDINHIKRTIAIASGKGGVGKSTVAAGLAVALTKAGYRVGILDADIYGPSQPLLFNIPNFVPEGVQRDMGEYIVPAMALGVKISSIGFFVGEGVPLAWRGPMAVNALKQLISQTLWEELDYLLIDMPPGTGDIQLSITQELHLDGAVVVSTPQQLATADVLRGIRLWGEKGVEVPILGIIENMAWFTPPDMPDKRYYIFGEGGARRLAETEGLPFLGEIPISENSEERFEKIVTQNGLSF